MVSTCRILLSNNLFEGVLEAGISHHLVNFAESDTKDRLICFYLRLAKLEELLFKIRQLSCLRCGSRGRVGRRSCSSISSDVCLRFQPHKAEHFAYPFFQIGVQIVISWNQCRLSIPGVSATAPGSTSIFFFILSTYMCIWTKFK